MKIHTGTRRAFLKDLLVGGCGSVLLMQPTLAATVKKMMPQVTLDFMPEGFLWHKRSEWTDSSPKTWLLREAGKFDRVTIHHSGVKSHSGIQENAVIYSLGTILKTHMDRNYGDIGYHILVDRSGGIWEGRSLAYEGAHVLNQNERNIGIVLLGNFEQQSPSMKQAENLNRLVSVICEHYDIKRHRIYGHRDLGHSVCPGRNLYKIVRDLVNLES